MKQLKECLMTLMFDKTDLAKCTWYTFEKLKQNTTVFIDKTIKEHLGNETD